MGFGTCGNCRGRYLLETSSNRAKTIISSWDKQRLPEFISVYEALAIVFEIPPLTSTENGGDEKKEIFRKGSKFTANFRDFDPDEEWEDVEGKEERWGLCNNCLETLTVIYNNLQEFISTCKAESEVAKVLKELESRKRNVFRVSVAGGKKGGSRSQSENGDGEDAVPNTIVKSEPVERGGSDDEMDDAGLDHLSNNDGSTDMNDPLVPIKQQPRSPEENAGDSDGDAFTGVPSPETAVSGNEQDKENEKSQEYALRSRTASGRPKRNAAKKRGDYVEFSSDSEDDTRNVVRPQLQNRTPLRPQVKVVRSGDAVIRQLKCPHCDKLFLHENVLTCHRRIVHRENIKLPRPLPIPQLPFYKISGEDRERALQESAGKVSTCPVCQMEVPRNEVRNHLSKHTRSINRPFMCLICGNEYLSHEDLVEHSKSHQTACVPCTRCGKRVSRLEIFSHSRVCGGQLKTTTFTTQGGGHVWTCKLCRIKFHSRQKMLLHMERHKQKSTHSCKICDRTFNSVTAQRLHIKRFHRNNQTGPPSVRSSDVIHDGDDDGAPVAKKSKGAAKITGDASDVTPIIDNRYVCKDCRFEGMSEREMETHMREQHANLEELSCSICNRKLQDEFCLNLHLNSHIENLPMKCFVCEKTYFQKSNFYYHLKDRHSLEPKTIIIKYPQIFSPAKTATGVRIKGQKMQSAPKKGEFPCETCGKVFPFIHSLRNHRKYVHDKVRNFICSYCGKSFPRKSYFQLHEKLHTSTETPYKCHLCGKGFRLPGNLRCHLRSTIHNPDKTFVCEVCGKGFNRMDNMRLHVKAVHLKLPTRKPRSGNNSDAPRRQVMGRRRVYGTELSEQNDSYIPNLPSTSSEPVPGTSRELNQNQRFSSPHDLEVSSVDENSSQMSTESKVSTSHHNFPVGSGAGAGSGLHQLGHLHMPVIQHTHSQATPQNIIDAALNFAQAQAEFPAQPQLGFNFRGSQYR